MLPYLNAAMAQPLLSDEKAKRQGNTRLWPHNHLASMRITTRDARQITTFQWVQSRATIDRAATLHRQLQEDVKTDMDQIVRIGICV